MGNPIYTCVTAFQQMLFNMEMYWNVALPSYVSTDCQKHNRNTIWKRTRNAWLAQGKHKEQYTVIDWVRGQQQLSEAAGWGQQIRSRVKQNCCCPRTQSITVLLYTFIFSKLSHSVDLKTISTHIFIRYLKRKVQ